MAILTELLLFLEIGNERQQDTSKARDSVLERRIQCKILGDKKKSLGLRGRLKRSAGDICEPRLLNGYI